MSELKTWPTQYGPIVQRKIYANLFSEVIRAGKCVLCAACIAVCPVNAMAIMAETPRLSGICIKCGYCYYACPSTTDESFSGFEEERDRIEEKIFGLKREEVFGVYRKIFVVNPVDDPEANPDEAVIRMLMAFGLERRYFDVVGFAGYGEPVTKYMLLTPLGKWEASAVIASSPEELKNIRLKTLTPGMTYNSVRGALEELVSGFFYGVDPVRVALFGPPQHIRSVWRMRFSWSEHRKLSRTIVFTASYFHRPLYSYTELRKIFAAEGLNIDALEDWKFEDDGVSFKFGEEWKKLSYEKLEPAIYKGFTVIKDPTGEYADISVGKVKGLEGIVIIARSEEGVKLVEEALEAGVLEAKEFNLDDVLNGLRSLYG